MVNLDSISLTPFSQLLFSYFVWSAVILVGGLSQQAGKEFQKRSTDEYTDGYWANFEDDRLYEESSNSRTSVELTNSEFLAALDSVFTFANSTKQFVVNLISVSKRETFECYLLFSICRLWEE